MFGPDGNSLKKLEYRWGNDGRETYQLALDHESTVTVSYSLVWEITSTSATFKEDLVSYNTCSESLCIFLDTETFILHLYV